MRKVHKVRDPIIPKTIISAKLVLKFSKSINIAAAAPNKPV